MSGLFRRAIARVNGARTPFFREADLAACRSVPAAFNVHRIVARPLAFSAVRRAQRPAYKDVEGTVIASARHVTQQVTEDLENIALKMQDIISRELFPCHIDVLGEHRRTRHSETPTSSSPFPSSTLSPALSTLVLSIVDVSENSSGNIPKEPHESSEKRAQSQSTKDQVAQLLVSSHLAEHRYNESGSLYLSSSDTKIELHYIPEACRGAAQLFLTGSQSYVDFLQLLAREGYGLELDKYGLWHRKEAAGGSFPPHQAQKMQEEAAILGNSRSRTTKDHDQDLQIPKGITIRKIDEEGNMASRPAHPQVRSETAGEQRMQAMRREMGLPEGLDLSLSLDDDFAVDKSPETGTSNFSSDVSDDKDGSEIWERIEVGNGSEAAILDVLGLVWLPPELRFVRNPSDTQQQQK